MTISELLSKLYTEEKEYYTRIATYYLKNRTKAECAVNEVFCKLLEKNNLQKLNITPSKHWVARCIKNHCLDLIKVEKNRNRILNENSITSTYANSIEEFSYKLTKKQLRLLVRKLSGRRKAVIVLYYFFGLKHKEIGKILKLETNRVGVELSRAIKDLNKLIAFEENTFVHSKQNSRCNKPNSQSFIIYTL